jgi:hypothetical protein
MRDSPRLPHHVVRAFHSSLSGQLDRRLFFYLRRRLDRPEELDALANRMFERLRAVPKRRLARAPVRY